MRAESWIAPSPRAPAATETETETAGGENVDEDIITVVEHGHEERRAARGRVAFSRLAALLAFAP